MPIVRWERRYRGIRHGVHPEANVCGTPAIAGIEGGTADAVVDGETGLRVDGTSIDEIAQAVVRVLSDSQFQDRLGQPCRITTCAKRIFMGESIADKPKFQNYYKYLF